MTEWQPTIDGLQLPELGTAPGAGSGASGIAAAALATVRALDEAQLLRPQDALTVQLVVELANAIGRGLSFGKVSVATSQLVRQLLDAMDTLPKPTAAPEGAEAFAQLTAAIIDGDLATNVTPLQRPGAVA